MSQFYLPLRLSKEECLQQREDNVSMRHESNAFGGWYNGIRYNGNEQQFQKLLGYSFHLYEALLVAAL
jgi:hypothetical protein